MRSDESSMPKNIFNILKYIYLFTIKTSNVVQLSCDKERNQIEHKLPSKVA